ncbi:hypothetical protein PPNK14_22890 [Pectobacterium parmentieri]
MQFINCILNASLCVEYTAYEVGGKMHGAINVAYDRISAMVSCCSPKEREIGYRSEMAEFIVDE